MRKLIVFFAFAAGAFAQPIGGGLGGGSPTGPAGGDLSGSYPNPTVAGLDTVPFCSGYTPTNGEFVQYTTGGSPSPCYSAAAATATGTAGGDLSGSYPNPTVASISNVVNPALQANTNVNCTNALGEFEVCSTVSTTPRGISSVEYQAGTASARFSGYKARGTQASPTTVVTGDFLTRWSGFGYDGANFIESSSIVASAQGTVAATRVPGQIDFATGTNATPSVLTTAMSILDTQVVNFTNNITIASATPFVTVNGTTCNLQGSCSPAGASVAWNAITNPTGNLSLAMTADTTVWTWGATTGSGVNLFTLTDTASNTGTGLLEHITTASGSAASPWGADANGIGFTVNSSGNLVSISTAKETIGTALGLGTSQTAYLTLQNTTASLSSGATVQVSPSVLWSGTAYQTTAAQSQTLQFQAYVLPATGSSLTGSWVLQASINGGAFANVITANPTGNTTFSGTIVTFIVTPGNNATLSLQDSGFSTSTGGALAVNMATGTVSNTSGADVGVKIQPTINQASGTGSYTAFDVAPIVTAQGSGSQYLQTWHAGSAGTTLEASMSFGGVLTDAGEIYTAAAPTVAASQIGFGSTVAANTNCGTIGTGCVVINVAGTTRYITYY